MVTEARCPDEVVHAAVADDATEQAQAATCPACTSDVPPRTITARYCIDCQCPETDCSPMCGYRTC